MPLASGVKTGDCAVATWEALSPDGRARGRSWKWKMRPVEKVVVFPCTSRLSRTARERTVRALAQEVRTRRARTAVLLPSPVAWGTDLSRILPGTRKWYEDAASSDPGGRREHLAPDDPDPLDPAGRFLLDECIALLENFVPGVALHRWQRDDPPPLTAGLPALKRYLNRHRFWYWLHFRRASEADPLDDVMEGPPDERDDADIDPEGGQPEGEGGTPAREEAVALARWGPQTRDAVLATGGAVVLPFSSEELSVEDVLNIRDLLGEEYALECSETDAPGRSPSAVREFPWCLEREEPDRCTLHCAGATARLRGWSARIMVALAGEAGHEVPPCEIDPEEKAEYGSGSDRFRVRAAKLRKKLKEVGLPGEMIKTVEGGYVLRLDPKRKRRPPC
jgi:hypothetical protein